MRQPPAQQPQQRRKKRQQQNQQQQQSVALQQLQQKQSQERNSSGLAMNNMVEDLTDAGIDGDGAPVIVLDSPPHPNNQAGMAMVKPMDSQQRESSSYQQPSDKNCLIVEPFVEINSFSEQEQFQAKVEIKIDDNKEAKVEQVVDQKILMNQITVDADEALEKLKLDAEIILEKVEYDADAIKSAPKPPQHIVIDKDSSVTTNQSLDSNEKAAGLRPDRDIKDVAPEKIAEAEKKSLQSISSDIVAQILSNRPNILHLSEKYIYKKDQNQQHNPNLKISHFSLSKQFKQGDKTLQNMIDGKGEKILQTRISQKSEEKVWARLVIGKKEPSGMFKKGEVKYIDRAHQRQHVEKIVETEGLRRRNGTIGGKKPEEKKALPPFFVNTDNRPGKAPMTLRGLIQTIMQENNNKKKPQEDELLQGQQQKGNSSDIDEPESQMSCEEEENLKKKKALEEAKQEIEREQQPKSKVEDWLEKKRERKAKDKQLDRELKVKKKNKRQQSDEDDDRDSSYERQKAQRAETHNKFLSKYKNSDGQRPSRRKKSKIGTGVTDEEETPISWNDTSVYFRRLQEREIDILRLQLDYGVGAIKKGNDTNGESPVESVLKMIEARSGQKLGSSDLTEEEHDMGINPDNYSGSQWHNIFVKSDQEDANFSQIWKFKECEPNEAINKVIDATMLESTKGSPTDRDSNKSQEIKKIEDKAVYSPTEVNDQVQKPAPQAEKPVPIDLMISELENMLELEVNTRELIDKFGEDEYMTNSQVEESKKRLDEAGDIKPKEFPSLELEEILFVGQRDQDAFIEPYNRSVSKAFKLFKEKALPYTQLDFELLTLTILVEEEVAQRHKNQLQKVLLRRVKDYQDEIRTLEENLDDSLARQDFASLFGIKKYMVGQVRGEMNQRMCRNPFEALCQEYLISAYLDDNTFYHVEDINKRCSKRAQEIWVFESLIRTYIASSTQPFPQLPKKIWLGEGMNQYIDTGLGIEDVLYDEAEKGCHICFTKEAQNYNPIMYCQDCNTGVHARCFGNGHIDNIDKAWICHLCREKKVYIEYQKEIRKIEAAPKQNKQMKEDLQKLQKFVDSKTKKLNKIACFLCKQKDGFMKYQKKFSKEQQSNWYHPFCVFMNKDYSWKKLLRMNEVVLSSQHYGPKKDQAFDTCYICKENELSKRKLIVNCHECKMEFKPRKLQKFHPFCAWKEGNQFKVVIQPNHKLEDASKFENKIKSTEFENGFYKDVFNLQIQMKCQLCAPVVLMDATLRKLKSSVFKTNIQDFEEKELPWLPKWLELDKNPQNLANQNIEEHLETLTQHDQKSEQGTQDIQEEQ